MIDEERILGFATKYAEAWSSGDPALLASFYSPDGSLKVNGGDAAVGRDAVEETARAFMGAFPDMLVELVELRLEGSIVVFAWHWTGTNTGPGGTGRAVDLTGYEEWTLSDEGLIRQSLGHFDEAQYQRQLNPDQVVGATGIITMQPRMSMITLGVEDLPRSIQFYEQGLGFPRYGEEENVAFFKLNGTWLGVYGREALAEDAGVDATGSGFRAFTISHNVASEEEVEAVMKQALEAGAGLVKKAEKTFWGGYGGYFSDPDGHLWEVAYNPFAWIGPADEAQAQ